MSKVEHLRLCRKEMQTVLRWFSNKQHLSRNQKRLHTIISKSSSHEEEFSVEEAKILLSLPKGIWQAGDKELFFKLCDFAIVF